KYVIECALGLEPGTVRAVAPDVGGGFGAKGGYGCYPEDVVLVWLARRLARPVRWCETRSESMVAMGHGRASTHHVRLGGTRAGAASTPVAMARYERSRPRPAPPVTASSSASVSAARSRSVAAVKARPLRSPSMPTAPPQSSSALHRTDRATRRRSRTSPWPS